jgi:hypothetical protein
MKFGLGSSTQHKHHLHLHPRLQDVASRLRPHPWFAMMLMPTRPPATKLTALADVSSVEEDEKMSIIKFVTILYASSPITCFAVVRSPMASLAIKPLNA